MDPKRSLIGAASLVLLAAAGCGSVAAGGGGGNRLPQGGEHVRLDPAQFTTRIDNPYWPMAPGSRWVYREEIGKGAVQRDVVTVTSRTKRVAAGVTARVVHDVATMAGAPVEDTFDWYAQDRAGNIWYLGEDTRALEGGRVVSTKGSWEAGVDGAQAGVALPAHPRVGMRYRQEFYARQAEDNGRVLSVDEQIEVPLGRFRHVLMTRDSTPLEPDLLEHKFYARGVGPVLSLEISGGWERQTLLRFAKGG